MGSSSRPEDFKYEVDDCFSAQETIDYFVDYLEKWRLAMDNLTDFILAGHSFGGYVVGNYALKYHQHIKKLLLLSPIGIRDTTGFSEEQYQQELDRRFEGRRRPP
jgi:cardiolipin-specific phospholipase